MRLLFFLFFLFPAIANFAQDVNLEEAKIKDIIKSLPEVRAIDGIYDTISNRYQKVRILITPPEKDFDLYLAEVGFQGNNRFQPHFYFYINPNRDQILVEDLEKGDRVTLEEWRERKNGPQTEKESEILFD